MGDAELSPEEQARFLAVWAGSVADSLGPVEHEFPISAVLAAAREARQALGEIWDQAPSADVAATTAVYAALPLLWRGVKG
jgi:hypothetical protein